jgi:DNA-binding NarL/FixJ family response regulator
MKTIFFSKDIDILDEWKNRHAIAEFFSFYEENALEEIIKNSGEFILIADYDSVASEINKMISSNALPENTIILEKSPEIATGKMLISHAVKAYGNSRMLSSHFQQMLKSVSENKVWTYPELTAALVKSAKRSSLSSESIELLHKRLTEKETEVVHLILEGRTNDAIASALGITTRTVKAHVGSIFTKLHVNDRLSLVLLLK